MPNSPAFSEQQGRDNLARQGPGTAVRALRVALPHGRRSLGYSGVTWLPASGETFRELFIADRHWHRYVIFPDRIDAVGCLRSQGRSFVAADTSGRVHADKVSSRIMRRPHQQIPLLQVSVHNLPGTDLNHIYYQYFSFYIKNNPVSAYPVFIPG